ncbi:Cytochrome P450 71A9 [Platanthera guangdongensis]|uniref:Cytochrome P450 71A9 n=1 Tax=Platanthera guangdongensis TaxID=2320717 RepID=A0ABR2MSB7_9ASPA
MEQLAQLFLLLLFLAVSFLLLKTARKKNLRPPPPPGPWRLPIVGNLHLLDPTRPHRSLKTLSLKHGPLMLLQLGSIPTLVVSSQSIAEEIFRRHDLAFSGRPLMSAAKKMFHNSSVTFSPYGDFWRQARKISMLELLGPRRVRAFEAVRTEEVAKLVAAVRDISDGGAAANLTELTLSLANNIVCRVTIGEEYGAGGYGGEGGAWLHDVLAEAQRLLGGFWMEDYFPAMGWVDRLVLRLKARLDKNFKEMDRFCDEAIQGHLSMKNKMDGGDYLQALLRLHKEKVAEGSGRGDFLTSMDHVKAIISVSQRFLLFYN